MRQSSFFAVKIECRIPIGLNNDFPFFTLAALIQQKGCTLHQAQPHSQHMVGTGSH